MAAAPIAVAALVGTRSDEPITMGERGDGSFLVSTGQVLRPAGRLQRTEGQRPKDLALAPDGSAVAVLCTGQVAFFTVSGDPIGAVPFAAGPLGIAWAPDGGAVYASANDGRVARLLRKDGNWRVADRLTVAEGTGNPQAAGLCVSPDGRTLYVALGIRNAVSAVDLATARVVRTVPVGVCPYRIALSPDGARLLVADRGGRPAPRGDRNAAPSAGTSVRVDRRTDAAAEGTVSIVDTATWAVRTVRVGRQPSGIAVSPDGRTAYVANSDSDDVSVVDVDRARVTRTVGVRPEQDPGYGQIPTHLALSADGAGLLVACGGANAVAVVSLAGKPRVTGYVPTAWFPVAIAARGDAVVVASSKGVGSRPANKQTFRVHDNVGAVQFLAPETFANVAASTLVVAANNRWGADPAARPGRAPMPVPEHVGEPSVFKHVVYVIKENHTYDVTLGDIPEGNGDPSLTLFGEDVTPNQHALARQFVLLDNTYTSGTNSADGHQWTSSSAANAYVEQNYSAHTRSYPYDGGDPLAYSPAGFIWNAASRARKSVRVYGEFVNRPKIVDPATGKRPTWSQLWADYKAGRDSYTIEAHTDNAALRPFLHPRFIGFPMIVSDQWRADQFLADLAEFERTGKMPALCVLLLPNDHTSGTTEGMPTPRAAVADNDLAFGRIVEAISRSRFWKETLILAMEDDSQLGLDHVDGHRTLAFCISPYTRRGVVVSEPYTHTSMIRTIGLVLGIPALNRFDRTALSLSACFTGVPDYTPFTHAPARVALDELNKPVSSLNGNARRLAVASGRQDWTDVDRADPGVVARAVWQSRRGAQPFPRHHFRPPERKDD